MNALEKLLARLPIPILDRFVKWAERRAIRKLGGIPIAWIIYRPWQDAPNVYIHTHPEVGGDDGVTRRMKDLAEYIRDNYGDKWEGE